MCNVTLLFSFKMFSKTHFAQECLVESDLLFWKVQQRGWMKTEHPLRISQLGSTLVFLVTHLVAMGTAFFFFSQGVEPRVP